MLADHLFLASNGDLYDTRRADWHKTAPLRRNYKWTYRHIANVHQLKATLRAGEFDIGYRLAFITSDGAALSFGAVRANFRLVADSIRTEINDGWRVVGVVLENETDETLYCDHTGEMLFGNED